MSIPLTNYSVDIFPLLAAPTRLASSNFHKNVGVKPQLDDPTITDAGQVNKRGRTSDMASGWIALHSGMVIPCS